MEKELQKHILHITNYRIKCKYGHDDKNVRLAELNISIATVFLNIKT